VPKVSNLGTFYRKRHNYAKARSLINSALGISGRRRLGQITELGRDCTLGVLYYEKARSSRLSRFSKKSLASMQTSRDRTIRGGKTNATLAALYVIRSMFDEAESSCQHAIEILKNLLCRLPVSGCSAKTPMPLYYRKRPKSRSRTVETREMTYQRQFHERTTRSESNFGHLAIRHSIGFLHASSGHIHSGAGVPVQSRLTCIAGRSHSSVQVAEDSSYGVVGFGRVPPVVDLEPQIPGTSRA